MPIKYTHSKQGDEHEMNRIIVTATEAAQILGTRPNNIQALLEAGVIPAYKVGRNWKIPYTLLQKYAEDRAIEEAKERRRDGNSSEAR